MADVTEITLGSRKFGIRPLTLRQLREVEAISCSGMTRRQVDEAAAAATAAAMQAAIAQGGDPAAVTAAAARAAASSQADGAGEDAETFVRLVTDRKLRTIVAALSRDFPEITADAILDMEIAPRELNDPYEVVLRLSGLVPSGEAARNP